MSHLADLQQVAVELQAEYETSSERLRQKIQALLERIDEMRREASGE